LGSGLFLPLPADLPWRWKLVGPGAGGWSATGRLEVYDGSRGHKGGPDNGTGRASACEQTRLFSATMSSFNYYRRLTTSREVVQMAPDWIAGSNNLGIALLNTVKKMVNVGQHRVGMVKKIFEGRSLRSSGKPACSIMPRGPDPSITVVSSRKAASAL